jgi:hypothetical protein
MTDKDLGGEFDAKDADIKKYAEEQQKKAAKPGMHCFPTLAVLS